MDCESLLRIPYKTYKIGILVVAIILGLFMILGNVEIYDVYNTNAYYKDKHLVFDIPITYSDTILNGEYLKIDGKKYDHEVIYVSDMLIDANTFINYQEVIVDIDEEFPENLVIMTSIYYDKEKVFTKLKKLF